jgi:hypothetical protein
VHGLYAGASLVNYFGSTSTLDDGDHSSHLLTYGIEVGYGIKLLDGVLTLRPQLGGGGATGTTSSPLLSNTETHVYLEPGLVVLAGLGTVLVGADANGMLFGDKQGVPAAFTAHAQVGLKF